MTDEAYIFDLKMLCGGYAYFSTFTMFDRFGKYHREFRKPSTVSIKRFAEAAIVLGQNPLHIENKKQFQSWLRAKGWAIAKKKYVHESMHQWLKSKECINSAISLFTDIDLVAPSTLKRSYSGKKKDEIIERDGNNCIICRSESELTMQHVIPFSKGGETTSRNLVTLCKSCNQELEDNVDYSLFDVAGLPHTYDRVLINAPHVSKEQLWKAADLSSNLMQTRCELW